MLFEMAGLGVLIPALGMLLNSDIGKDYPAFQPYLKALGEQMRKPICWLEIFSVQNNFWSFLKFSCLITVESLTVFII